MMSRLEVLFYLIALSVKAKRTFFEIVDHLRDEDVDYWSFDDDGQNSISRLIETLQMVHKRLETREGIRTLSSIRKTFRRIRESMS